MLSGMVVIVYGRAKSASGPTWVRRYRPHTKGPNDVATKVEQ
jgi:hypothetical protein